MNGKETDGKVTYHQQVSYCGKPRCRKCREGKGHGPYWYAYKTVNGQTTRTYIGKNLPSGAQQTMPEVAPVGLVEATAPSKVVHFANDHATAMIRISVLGQFRLERRESRQQRQWQGVTDAAWQQQRVRTLLGYLICSPGRRVSRAQAVEVLWPDGDTETANNNLNRVVHSLRQVLEPARGQRAQQQSAVPTSSSVRSNIQLLRTEGDWLVLAEQARVRIDADAFESLASKALQPMSADEDPSAHEALLREAIAMYGGDFLPEERQAEWAVTRRQLLRRSWIGLLLELADLCIKQGATANALEVLDRLLAAEPTNEAAVQRFIYVLAQLKRRGEALRAYHRLADVLRSEFNATPSAETRALFDAVRQGGELTNRIGISIANRQPIASLLPTTPDVEKDAPPAEHPVYIDSSQDSESGRRDALGGPTLSAVFADPTLMQIGRSRQSPLVGREMELEVLRSMLLDVEQGARQHLASQRRASGLPLDTQRRPQSLVLLGETGIGKTRLAEEMAREALRRGWSVIWSRVHPQESGVPYHIWVEVLRRSIVSAGFASAHRVWSTSRIVPAIDVNPLPPIPPAPSGSQGGQYVWPRMWQEEVEQGFSDRDMLEEPDEFMGNLAREAAYAAPGRANGRSAAAVDVSLPMQLQPLTALLPELASPTMTPSALPLFPTEQGELRLWEATRDLLISASESAPLLIVLDDIQWADDKSGKLLGYIGRQIYGYPIALVATCRDTELPTQPPHPLRDLIAHMQREHTIRTLPVDPLTPEEIRLLVSHLPEEMVRHIQEQAAGNPFFAEELARTTPPTLPKNIAAALQHRMSRLSVACKQLLENAAVLGGSFEFALLHAMEANRADADEDVVLDLLEEALQSGVLTEEGTGIHVTYHFWHPLLVSHLYDGISAIRRARLHQRAARVLRNMYRSREEEMAATITHHLVRGGADASEIARYAEMAGDRAYAFSAYTEAERHYRLALENLDVPMVATTTIASEPYDAHIVNLLERLAECTMIGGNFADARQLYERVLALRGSLQGTSEYEAQKQALLWGELGWTWRYNGDNVRARECCEHGEQVLRDAGIQVGPAWARLRHLQGSLYWLEGRYKEWHQAMQDSLTLFTWEPGAKKASPPVRGVERITRIQRTLEGDPVELGVVHRLLGALADAEGQLSTALEHLNTALVIFEQADHKRRIGHVSHDMSYVYIKKGQFELAEAALRRALSLAEQLGDVPLIGLVYSSRGELAAASGDLEVGEQWYRKSIALAERIQDREYISRWNARLAVILLDQGKLDEAETCIKRALRMARIMRNNPCIGMALVALGNLRIAQAQERASKRLFNVRTRLLLHARQDIQRAIALPELEMEMRIKGHLALAHCALLAGEANAREQILAAVQEARSGELVLVEARARRLLET